MSVEQTPAEVFHMACITVWGAAGYAERASAAIGVRPDTIRHWATGRRDLPPAVWPMIERLLSSRLEGLQKSAGLIAGLRARGAI